MEKLPAKVTSQLTTTLSRDIVKTLLTSKDKEQLVAISRGIDIQKAVSGSKLFQIQRIEGFDSMLDCVKFLLIDLNNFFNVKGMDKGQISETAELIVEKYYYSSLEDFVYCFKKIKKGEYGQLYNRLDGMIVLECLNKHEEEKAEHLESEHRKFKNQEKNILQIPNSLVEKSLEVLKDIEKEEKKNKMEKIKGINDKRK